MRAELEQVERVSGVHDPQLDVQEVEPEFEYLEKLFFSLWDGEAITWNALDAYSRLTGSTFTAFEIKALRSVSREAAKAIADITKDSV